MAIAWMTCAAPRHVRRQANPSMNEPCPRLQFALFEISRRRRSHDNVVAGLRRLASECDMNVETLQPAPYTVHPCHRDTADVICAAWRCFAQNKTGGWGQPPVLIVG